MVDIGMMVFIESVEKIQPNVRRGTSASSVIDFNHNRIVTLLILDFKLAKGIVSCIFNSIVRYVLNMIRIGCFVMVVRMYSSFTFLL